MSSIAVISNSKVDRDRLIEWINSSSDFRSVSEVETTLNDLTQVTAADPEVLLLDTDLLEEFRIAWVAQLAGGFVRAHLIILSSRSDDDAILDAFGAGAAGYLLKPSSRDEVLWAIAGVQSGSVCMSRKIANRMVHLVQRTRADRLKPLRVSPRENQVLELVSQGLMNKEIADQLGITYDTVCVHLRRIYKKLRVSTRTEAAVKYLKARPPGSIQNSNRLAEANC